MEIVENKWKFRLGFAGTQSFRPWLPNHWGPVRLDSFVFVFGLVQSQMIEGRSGLLTPCQIWPHTQTRRVRSGLICQHHWHIRWAAGSHLLAGISPLARRSGPWTVVRSVDR